MSNNKSKRNSLLVGGLTSTAGLFITKAIGILYVAPFKAMVGSENYVYYAAGYGGNYIIIETPAPAPPPVLTPAQQRERAYREDKVIEWQGEMLTCDEARLSRMSAYYYSGQTEKLAQIQQLWLDARESIQLQYPDGNGTL